jgi:8-oxo-dGTP pyrophosphatase MutT (NUDIX family)
VDAVTAVRAAGGVLWRQGHIRQDHARPVLVRLGPDNDGAENKGADNNKAADSKGAARHDPVGVVEIALVHRPRYDDWSLPKGKLWRGEHPIVGACREVFEETGVRPRAGPRLPSVSYPVRVGADLVDKVVDYWAMTVVEDAGFTPDTEVDAVAWLQLAEALGRLSYPHDVQVVTAFAEMKPVTGLVVLLRHAQAGKREAWPGPDGARPLDQAGRTRAAELVGLLRCFEPVRLVSASPRRCVQTLAPLATELDLPIEVEAVFEESADPLVAAERLRLLVAETEATVVCSQGRLIPAVLSALDGRPRSSFRTAKGAAWAISFADAAVVAVDRL